MADRAAVDLGTPTKRVRLAPRHRPYWSEIARGAHLGYRKADPERPGIWYGRVFVRGGAVAAGKYDQWKLGAADDGGVSANGSSVLSHRQATDVVLRGRPTRQEIPTDSAAYTVDHALKEYVDFLKSDRKSGGDAEPKLRTYVSRRIGTTPLARLTHDDLTKWRTWALTYKPPGRRDWPKYLREATTAAALIQRYREARDHLGKALPPRVIAAHERREKELAGTVKLRRRPGPKPSRPRVPQRVVDAAEADRRKKETVNKVINYLKAALNRAYANGRVSSKDAWARLQRWRGTGSARQGWLTVEESQRLRNAADPSFRPAIEAGLVTGCRWGELRQAQVKDYHRAGRSLLIPKSKSNKPRHVPLNEEGTALFDRLTVGKEPNDLILTKPDGKPWGINHHARPMREAVAAARLHNITFHNLRHTYASHLVQAGVPTLFVATALGNSERMVERIYGHLKPTNVADAVRANLPAFGITVETNVRRLAR